MASCTHVQWLRLHQDHNESALQYSDRLANIAKSLPNPSTQYPSHLSFFGRTNKAAAIRAIFPESRIAGCRNDGISNICVDPASITDEHPLILSNSTSKYNTTSQRATKGNCHETIDHPVAWPSDWHRPIRPEGLVDHVHASLLSLFIDVICIFAADCGGIDGVIDKLTVWARIGSVSAVPGAVRPRVVIVTSVPLQLFDSEALRIRLLLSSTPQFPRSFSSLNIVNVLQVSHRLHYDALEHVLAMEIQAARFERIHTRSLFSMVHLAEFFSKALYHFVRSPEERFYFIQSSRDDNPVTVDFQDHLGLFLQLCVEQKFPVHVTVTFIASAILLDSFPPDMHLFNPSDVFRALYRPLCLLGLQSFASTQNLSMEIICGDIEAQMITLFTQMDRGGQSASAMRRQSLKLHAEHWALLKTMRTCLFCLRRMSEHVMDCGHAICETCICIFGEPKKGKEYYFGHESCILCQKKVFFQARLLPPTCRVRVLSIDGGGSRAVVPIKYIGALQEALDLPYPVQEQFDFAIGTSSGGLVVLAFFVNYWNPKQCLKFFKMFARRVFPPKIGFRPSPSAKIRRFFASYFAVRRFFASYLADGQYNAAKLEETLQETFGSRLLFDSPRSRPSGMKIAITTTTISDTTLCMFSNYNGVGNKKDLGYKHLRASRIENEVSVWEAARCITAAPGFFKTKYLPLMGTFQDGALRYNNPTRPGLREVNRIWKDGDVDLVLSIGTGFNKQLLMSPKAPDVRNLLLDGFVPRLYRSFMTSISLHGRNSWIDHFYGLTEETKAQHFRLDLPLTGKEPGIDEVDKMEYLQNQVPLHLGDMEGIARAFKAAEFFFELDEPITRDTGVYRCRGSILSRSPNSRALIQNLTATYPFCQFLTNSGSPLGFLSMEDICQACGRFQKTATFNVRHPSDVVNIFLVFNRLFRRNISGFPHSVGWFEDRQMLKAQFGRPDHRMRSPQRLDLDCICVQRRRYCVPPTSTTSKRAAIWGSRRRSKRQCLR